MGTITKKEGALAARSFGVPVYSWETSLFDAPTAGQGADQADTAEQTLYDGGNADPEGDTTDRLASQHDRALAARGPHAEVLCNRAIAQQLLGRYDDALASYAAAAAAPGSTAQELCTRAIARQPMSLRWNSCGQPIAATPA